MSKRDGGGRWCRICERRRPNERFSGRGWARAVCKRCESMPAAQRQAIEGRQGILGFVDQSRISQRNVARLRELGESTDPWVARAAAVLLEVARVAPFRHARRGRLRHEHPELFDAFVAAGLGRSWSECWSEDDERWGECGRPIDDMPWEEVIRRYAHEPSADAPAIAVDPRRSLPAGYEPDSDA